MTFEQITNPKKEVRVLRSTYHTKDERTSLIGKIVQVRIEDNYDNTLSVWNEDKTDHWVFNRSDVQFLVPEVMYEGQRIGIGDKLRLKDFGDDCEVYGYHWSDRQWLIDCVLNKNIKEGCYHRSINSISSHTPLYKETKTLTRQEIADKFGIALEDLKIEG